MASFLLVCGAHANAFTKLMKTPLHFACQLGHKLIAQILINYQSNVNAKDMLKMTPLHWAVERNHSEIVELLCKCDKIDLTCIDKFNRTCMDIAIKNNNSNLVSYLNDAKNIINIRIQLEKSVLNNQLGISQNQICFNETQHKESACSFSAAANVSMLEILKANEAFQTTNFAEADSTVDAIDASRNLINLNDNTLTIGFDQAKVTADANKKKFEPNLNINKPIEINRKSTNSNKAYYLIEESDTDTSGDECNRDSLLESISSKRKRISHSPVSIEETLNWLKSQSQAMRDNSDGLENRELFLTGIIMHTFVKIKAIL
jgi:ankyrin repeat protein